MVHNEFAKLLARRPSALKRLKELENAANNGMDLPAVWIKRSGQGRQSTFPPYQHLRLHHSKLDPNKGGDPLLVLQEVAPGELVSVALADHANYASSDPDVCDRWLWEHRNSLDWTVTEEASAYYDSLSSRFGGDGPKFR